MPHNTTQNTVARSKYKSLRDVVHKVMALQSATRCFIHNAEEALGTSFWGNVVLSSLPTEVSSYEEEDKTSHQKHTENIELAFDTSFFKTQYEFTFPEKAIAVALRRPEERSPQDIRFIRSMMMGILSFRRYSTHMQLMLARVVYYRRFGRGRVIVRKGHRGDSFYFVFSGVIAVTQDVDGRSALLDPEPILLHKGTSFGEVALLKGLRRNATLICMEDTEFLVVDRKEFFRNKLDQELQKELQFRFQFFRSLDLFSSWSDESLETLADHCKIEECTHSQVIVNDTSETKNIIFVTKGRCEVLRLVDLSQCPSFLKWLKQHDVLLGPSSLLTHTGRSVQNTRVQGDTSHGKTDAGGGLISDSRSISVENIAQRNGLPLSYSETLKGLVLPEDLVAGVYLRIDSIHPGQYFRGVDVDYIESCLEREGRLIPEQTLTFVPTDSPRDPRSMVIVSQGADIIRIKLDKFTELADLKTLKKLKSEMTGYPSDNDLCRVFLEQNKWKVFKSDLVNCLSSTPSLHPKLYPNIEKGKGDRNRPCADRSGILQLGTRKTRSAKFWTTPINPKAPEPGRKDHKQHNSTQGSIRLIHGIDIPKLCGKRVMW
ncbi:cyclic nucleotide-binding domain-containing protein 2-like [Pelobates fuscus]|uniref:cyclic nucleotide-binding domain-containing protein 2-like n=1 Tax=Pelobates fuscus TaxID=191477 RepID=UPI002FE4CA84